MGTAPPSGASCSTGLRSWIPTRHSQELLSDKGALQQLRKERGKKQFPPQFEECLSVVSTLPLEACGVVCLGAREVNFRRSRVIIRELTDA